MSVDEGGGEYIGDDTKGDDTKGDDTRLLAEVGKE